MKSLKTKASHFFRDGPSRDEKAANAERADFDIDFNAGIQERVIDKKRKLKSVPLGVPGLKSSASRFFLRKNDTLDKPLPAPPSDRTSTSQVITSLIAQHTELWKKECVRSDDHSPSQKPLPFPLAPYDLVDLSRSASVNDKSNSALGPLQIEAAQKLKSRPSFATLRSKESRIFRSSKDPASHQPPLPPIPQIPVQPPEIQPCRPVLAQLHAARGSRPSIASIQGRSVSISRPIPMQLPCNPPMPAHAATVPFTKPTGPPPPRPPRPEIIDEDTLAFMRGSATRMVLPTSNRTSASTATDSTPRSHTSSIESRLGLPSGHCTPVNWPLDSSLAAHFPQDPSQPLPVRDSSGSIRGFSRFSEYVKTQQDGYAVDGVDPEDRDRGPIEQYRRSKEGDWTMVKRVSRGPNGNPGMLFRDRWGAFHFVADI